MFVRLSAAVWCFAYFLLWPNWTSLPKIDHANVRIPFEKSTGGWLMSLLSMWPTPSNKVKLHSLNVLLTLNYFVASLQRRHDLVLVCSTHQSFGIHIHNSKRTPPSIFGLIHSGKSTTSQVKHSMTIFHRLLPLDNDDRTFNKNYNFTLDTHVFSKRSKNNRFKRLTLMLIEQFGIASSDSLLL